MNRKSLVIVVVLIATVIVGASWWVVSERRAAAARDKLVLFGNVDIRDVSLGFRVSGRLAELKVDEGDTVMADQVLGRLDDEPYRRKLTEAQAALASAKAKLDLLLAGSREEDTAQSAAQVDQAAAVLADAQRNFDRQKALRGTGASSQRQYDDALSQRDQAAANLKSLREVLRKSRNGNRLQEIEQARADANRSEASVAQAQLDLDDTVLKASGAGTVMTRAVEPGAILATGASVFSVSLNDPVWVRAYVAERDLGRVRPGGVAYVHSDTQPDHHYKGVIGYVSPTAEFTPKSVETQDLRTDLVYRLRIVVTDADGGLRQGMPVTAELRFDEAPQPVPPTKAAMGGKPPAPRG